MDIQQSIQGVVDFLKQLEGPYKWYVIGAIAWVLTGLITRFIFKTFKWFIILLIIGGIVLGGIWLLANLSGL